jgi:hypothetical protein
MTVATPFLLRLQRLLVAITRDDHDGHPMSIQLGRIERVDLRSVWTNEGRDFTPWLATEENLAILGEARGIDLELEAEEKDVVLSGPIFCAKTLRMRRG